MPHDYRQDFASRDDLLYGHCAPGFLGFEAWCGDARWFAALTTCHLTPRAAGSGLAA
jgi:hypothetical protein